MKSLKARLLALLAMVTILLTVSGPAMAQEWDEGFWWGDLWCVEVDFNLLWCSDGNFYEEVDAEDVDDDWTWGDEEEDGSWPPGGGAPWDWDDDEEEE